MKFLAEAYGCTLNRGEAEEFIDGMLETGHEPAETPESADIIAIFTCGVIETTENHMLRRIREFSKWPEKRLLVCGCLPRISPDRIKAIAPHAELFGPAEQAEALTSVTGKRRQNADIMRSSVGILPIATGCAGSCTYCITKHARGALVSRPPGEVGQRLGALISGGAAEIQLCAQDTAVYGLDIGTDLAALTQVIDELDGDFMVRIGMMNPASVKKRLDRILKAYSSPKVFKFLHLPVQSGSDAILERMQRGHTAADFTEIVGAFRAHFPDMVLSTDIIIGFPGETDAQFAESAELMRKVKPDIINVTRFSSRPGTEADSMIGKVPGRIAKDRSREMSRLRFELTAESYCRFKGRNLNALATERRKPGTTFLRTADYRPIVVPAEIALGRRYGVKITGRARTHLTGILESE